jgi:hypothetical protein
VRCTKIPPTELEKKFISPDIVRLVGNSLADSLLNRLSHNWQEYYKEVLTYFTKGICKKCGSPLGKRNNKPIPIESTGLYNDKKFKFLEVERKRSRKKYYELLGEIEFVYVGVKGLTAKGWRCNDCSNTFALYEIPDQLSINCYMLDNGSKTNLVFL